MTPDAMHTPDDFQLHLHFAVPGDRLFTALATEEGCKGWWTLFCEVGEQTGGRSSFYFPGDGFYAVMKILQREPAQRLEWMCVESKHNENTGYTDLHSWIDTRIRLLIKDLGDGSSQLADRLYPLPPEPPGMRQQ